MDSKPPPSSHPFFEAKRQEAAEHERRMREDPAYRAEHDRAERERKARKEEATRVEDGLKRMARRASMRIPRRVSAYLDDLWETDARAAVLEFMASDCPLTFLVLGGGVGTSKTVAACHGLDLDGFREVRRVNFGDVETVRVGLRGLFVPASEFNARAIDADFWKEVREVDRLVLDDLERWRWDDRGWAAAQWYGVVNSRYDGELKTIITTNLILDDFKRRFLSLDGGRLLDRFHEAGRFQAVRGDSLRRPRAAGGAA